VLPLPPAVDFAAVWNLNAQSGLVLFGRRCRFIEKHGADARPGRTHWIGVSCENRANDSIKRLFDSILALLRRMV
jgi:hypothetical protein